MKKNKFIILFLIFFQDSYSQSCNNPFFDFATIEYVSTRQDRAEGKMYLSYDKKYNVEESDENHNYLTDKKGFTHLSNYMVKNTTCLIDSKTARRKAASFKIELYKDSSVVFGYFVSELTAYNYFEKLAIELKKTDLHLSNVVQSLIDSDVLYYFRKK